MASEVIRRYISLYPLNVDALAHSTLSCMHMLPSWLSTYIVSQSHQFLHFIYKFENLTWTGHILGNSVHLFRCLFLQQTLLYWEVEENKLLSKSSYKIPLGAYTSSTWNFYSDFSFHIVRASTHCAWCCGCFKTPHVYSTHTVLEYNV